MTYSQKKSLQTLVDFCVKNQLYGLYITEQDGKFTVTKNGETTLESVSFDECYAFLTKLADMLNTCNGIIKKAQGKEMSDKLKKQYPEG